MKKKIINGLLFAAMIIVASGAFVSCKDYEEDRIRSVEGKFNDQSNLIEVLKGQIRDLEREQHVLDSIQSICGDNCKNLRDSLSYYLTVSDAKNTYLTLDSASYYYTKEAADELFVKVSSFTNLISRFEADSAIVHAAQDKMKLTIDTVKKNLNDLEGRVTIIDGRLSNVEGRTDTLQAQVAALMADSIQKLIGMITDVNTVAANARAKADTAYADAKQALSELNTIRTTANNAANAARRAQNTADSAKTQAGNAQQVAEQARQAAEQAQKAANYAADLAKRDSIRLDNLDKLLAGYDTTVIANLATWGPQLTSTIEKANAASALAEKDSIRIDKLVNDYDSIIRVLKETDSRLDKRIDTIATEAARRIDSLARITTTLSEEIVKVKQLADTNLVKSKAYADTIAQHVRGEISGIKGEIYDSIGNVRSEIYDSIARVRQEIFDSLGYIPDSIAALRADLGTVAAKFNKFEKEMRDSLTNLRKDIDSVTVKLNRIDDKLNKLSEKFDNVMNSLITNILIQGTKNPVLGYSALPFNMRSNILAAYYGKANENGVEFPTTRPRYYVDQDADRFTSEDRALLGGSFNGQIQIDGGDLIVNEEEGNAGTIYLTINSYNNTADFTGAIYTLENSLGEQGGIKLGALKKSDYRLTFGGVRAANNGFYEAPATISVADLDNVTKIDIDDLRPEATEVKDAVKDILSFRDGVNLTDAANSVFNLLNKYNEQFDAYAVKAPWTDDNGDHAMYSQYALAAGALRPLSYSFLKDTKISHIPGLGRVENAIERTENLVADLLNKININIDFDLGENIDSLDLGDISHVDSITISDANKLLFNVVLKDTVVVQGINKHFEFSINDTIAIKDTVWVDPNNHALGILKVINYEKIISYYDDISIVKADTTIYINVNYDVTPAIEEMLGSVNDNMDDVNTMIDKLKGMADQVNSVINQINNIDISSATSSIDDAKKEIKQTLNSYLDRLYGYVVRVDNRLVGLVNKANTALQPVLLAKTNGGFTKLSQAAGAPSTINGTTLNLVPTSYTGELFAPAFKKFIAVTNVFKDGQNAHTSSALRAVAQAANTGNLNKVIDGSEQLVELSGLQSGYVYEIAYSAVDFSGLVVLKRFYVKVG